MAERGRFAPTPSGRMHLGNVFSALLAWLSVRAAHGELVLRIEDLDTLRCSAENAEILKDDLRWLGLTWDAEQPDQSTRSEYYESILDRLRGEGFVYPCWCTRGDLKNAANAPHASDGTYVYAGTCRGLSRDEAERKAAARPPATRLRVPAPGEPADVIGFRDLAFGEERESLSRECGDFLVRRSDGVVAYQLAVVVDDAEMGVTQVVRGRDLLGSVARQMYLQRLLGYDHPSYGHVPLLVAPDGRRLSKREHDLDLGVLRQTLTAGQLLGKLAFLAGLLDRPEAASAAELTREFDWTHVFTKNIFVNSVFFHR